ncbi:conserved hypothetical protein [Ricinus communis]|uniref:Uncharacterized protein n=1 Tax=Ricinus communis TaxID=3988 RepID=B9T3R8_RICCO|nr:conserved hypothetical protein [Ricinus communis]
MDVAARIAYANCSLENVSGHAFLVQDHRILIVRNQSLSSRKLKIEDPPSTPAEK